MTTYAAEYQRRWRQDRKDGVVRLVDTTNAKQHLDTLVGAGWSARGIAGESGMSVQSISRILNGQQRANRVTVAAILNVNPATLPTKSYDGWEPFVPRIGTIRRIQALLAMGWPHHEMQRRSGVHTRLLISQQGRWVTRSTHDKMAALFRDIVMTRGPSEKSRAWACKLGYALPLQWDDIDLDHEPLADAVAYLPGDRATRIEDLQFMADSQVGATEAAHRVGMSATTLDRYLRRGGPEDHALLTRLLRQDPISVTRVGGRVA